MNQNGLENSLQQNEQFKESFINVLSEFSNNIEKISEIFKKLHKLYSSKERYYHTLKHIEAMLAFIQKRRNQIKDYKALYLAIWYHDAIYNSKSKTNEKDSAEMMKKDLMELGLPEDLIEKIYTLIIATEKHQSSKNDTDCNIFLDSDLSILSKPKHVYEIYAQNIRKEYSWVPEDQYRSGRKSVLEGFLRKERIYFSAGMEEPEKIARENLQQEIESLS